MKNVASALETSTVNSWIWHSKMIRIWFTPDEIVGRAGMPSTARSINRRGMVENWQRRKRAVGKGFEYHIDSLPESTQSDLIIEHTPATATTNYESEKIKSEELWRRYDLAKKSKKTRARHLLDAINQARALIKSGEKSSSAWAYTAFEFHIGKSTLIKHYGRIKNYAVSDWLAALLPQHKGKIATVKCSAEAWEFFKSDYLRNEKPSYSACYHRLERAAIESAWSIPSIDTLKRKMISDVSMQVRVFAREGTPGLLQLYPSQQRTVKSLSALEWINGDGYQHNVFVIWPNGDIARPKTWFWQDIFSRKILSYRTDQTEHTDLLRFSIGDLLDEWGIPSDATIDNTRAAANKWLTGGVPNRYRFKVLDDDPIGILPALNINVHWTSVIDGHGHGQAKPVERSFGIGGLGEYIDKHPYLGGSYTGANVNSKPENYRSKAIPLADFIRILNQEIVAWNAKTGRRTEMAKGTKSFDQVFAESYETSIIRKANEEQKRLWLLAAEAMTVQRGATVTLDAGSAVGKGRNRYHAAELTELIGQKIVVRFDPQDLHEYVYIYSLDGQYICNAPCVDATGFGDTVAGREFSRARKQWMRAAKEATKAETKMSILDIAGKLPELDQPDHVIAKIVRPFTAPTRMTGPANKLNDEQKRTVSEFKKQHAQESATVISMVNHERDSRTVYSDWMMIERRIESGNEISAKLIRALERYKQTSDYKAESEFFADFDLSIDDYASTKKPDSESG